MIAKASITKEELMKQKIEINKILDEVICPFVKWEGIGCFSDDRLVFIGLLCWHYLVHLTETSIEKNNN